MPSNLFLDRRIGKARLLRRQGKTYDEIRAVIGSVRDEVLQVWLKGIPRPKATHRSAPMTEMRRQCRIMRTQGMAYDEIIQLTGASKGSLSLWLRGLPGPDRKPYDFAEHMARIQPMGAIARHEQAVARRELRLAEARSAVGSRSDRDLFMLGLALYWAEGTKCKPWSTGRSMTFINSDASVLDLYLAWLDLLAVSESDRTYRLMIHESADVAQQETWWSERLGVPLAAFHRATIKRHNPKTIRRNVGVEYRGCLVVKVYKSTALYDSVQGWWEGVSRSLVG